MVQSESNTRCHPIDFSSEKFQLKGFLHLPVRTPAPVVIGSHGLLSNADSPKQIALAEGCTARGLAFFRFDHRGCGNSQGVFKDVTSLSARCNDLIDAAKAIMSRPDIGPVLGLFGSSMGGATCLATAKILSASAVVTNAAPLRSGDIAGAASSDMPTLSFDISQKLAGLNRLLIFHGDADDVVPVENAHEILCKVEDPKRLVIQTGGDHPMSSPNHQRDFVRQTVDWFCRYLPAAADADASSY